MNCVRLILITAWRETLLPLLAPGVGGRHALSAQRAACKTLSPLPNLRRGRPLVPPRKATRSGSVPLSRQPRTPALPAADHSHPTAFLPRAVAPRQYAPALRDPTL